MSVDIDSILEKSVQMKVSDVHIKAGSQPIVRIDGKLSVLHDEKRLSSEDTLAIASQVMKAAHFETFNKTHDVDVAYGIAGQARFRCNFVFDHFHPYPVTDRFLRDLEVFNPPDIKPD